MAVSARASSSARSTALNGGSPLERPVKERWSYVWLRIWWPSAAIRRASSGFASTHFPVRPKLARIPFVARVSRIWPVYPASEPASNVSEMAGREGSPWRMTYAGPDGGAVVAGGSVVVVSAVVGVVVAAVGVVVVEIVVAVLAGADVVVPDEGVASLEPRPQPPNVTDTSTAAATRARDRITGPHPASSPACSVARVALDRVAHAGAHAGQGVPQRVTKLGTDVFHVLLHCGVLDRGPQRVKRGLDRIADLVERGFYLLARFVRRLLEVQLELHGQPAKGIRNLAPVVCVCGHHDHLRVDDTAFSATSPGANVPSRGGDARWRTIQPVRRHPASRTKSAIDATPTAANKTMSRGSSSPKNSRAPGATAMTTKLATLAATSIARHPTRGRARIDSTHTATAKSRMVAVVRAAVRVT